MVGNCTQPGILALSGADSRQRVLSFSAKAPNAEGTNVGARAVSEVIFDGLACRRVLSG